MDKVPVNKDPSDLTTQQLNIAVTALKELLLAHIDRIDQAIIVAHNDLTRFPTDVDEKVASLKELLTSESEGKKNVIIEQFNSVNKRLDFIEAARIEQKTDTATAVTNALNAAKEAVKEQNISNNASIAKSEFNFSKLIEQQRSLIDSIIERFNDQVDDIKKRLTIIEGLAQGSLNQKVDQRRSATATRDIIALVAMILFGILGYVLAN